MIDLLPYILKSSICLTLCYGFYYLLLKQESTLVFNRIYLIGTVLLSVIIPFISIPIQLPSLMSFPHQSAVSAGNTIIVESSSVAQVPSVQAPTNFIDWLLIAFLAISAVFFVRFVINVARILYNSKVGEQIRYNNSKLILSAKIISPHTFFKFIFLNKKDYETGVINEEVLQHEQAHCDQLHTIDILFIEFIKIFFWWNPLIWMYKQSIQLNHEYLADKEVLQHINIIDYQKAILSILEQNQSLALVSHFNYYSIKKRFIMMTKMNSNNKSRLWRIWLFLPVLLGMFALTFTTTAQENNDEKEKEKRTIKIELKGQDLSQEEIDNIIAEELAKHKLDKKDVNVNVDSNNGVTVITINGGKAFVIEIDDEDILERKEGAEKNEVRVIRLSKDIEENVKWITENDEALELEMEEMEKELEIELKDLDHNIKVIQLKTEDDMKRKMEEIEIRLEEIGERKEEIMMIIEEELMRKNELEERKIEMEVIEMEKESKKNRKRK